MEPGEAPIMIIDMFGGDVLCEYRSSACSRTGTLSTSVVAHPGDSQTNGFTLLGSIDRRGFRGLPHYPDVVAVEPAC